MSVLDDLINELRRLRGSGASGTQTHEMKCMCLRCDPGLHADMRAIQRAEDSLQEGWDREDARGAARREADR